MAYAVPQGVDLEDKIIGSITMKQLGILGLGGGICYVAYTKMDAFIWPFVIGIVAPLTLAFAFVKIYEMTFFQLLMSFVSYYLKPEKRVWTGHADTVKLKQEVKKDETADLEKEAIASKIHKMTNLDDIIATTQTAREKVGEELQKKPVVAPAIKSKIDASLPDKLAGLAQKIDLNKAAEKLSAVKQNLTKVVGKVTAKPISKYTQHLQKPEIVHSKQSVVDKTEDKYAQRVAEMRQSLIKPKLSQQQVVKQPAIHPSEVKAPIAKSTVEVQPKLAETADKLAPTKLSSEPIKVEPKSISAEEKAEKIRQLQLSILKKTPPVPTVIKAIQSEPSKDELTEGEEIQF